MDLVHRGRALWLVLACLLASLAGPAWAYQPEPCPPQPDPAGEAVPDTHLYFVTTRLPDCQARPVKFGESRAEPSFGYFRTMPPPRPGRPGAVASVLRPQAAWFDVLRADLAGTGGRLLIYIHGYFNSFEEATTRAQAIRRQTGFAGPMLVFSWPSENCLVCYTHDEENALWTQPYFDRLLTGLVQEPGVTGVTLLAHSMGNRILLRSVAEVDRAAPGPARAKIQTIVLAAPDVDRAIVDRDYLSVLDQPGRRTTVYASRADTALRTSWKVHGYPRAGDTACRILDLGTDAARPRCVLALRVGGAVTLVDTSLVSAGAGHRDFIESRAAALDFCRVLQGRLVFPGRVPMTGHPGAVLLTNAALSPADCP